MICPKCGKETPDNSQSCVNCGVKFIRKPRQDTPARTTVTPSGEIPKQPDSPGSGAAQTMFTSGKETGGPSPEDTGKMVVPSKTPESTIDAQAEPSERPISEEEEHLRRVLSDRHEIIKKLGAGGMATVYLAREIALDRKVAIKVLPKAFVRDADFVARFKNEAQVAANLEHPHIVRIYQISEEKDLVYFVMSFIPSGSVTDRIKKQGTIPVDDIVKWGIDVCSALAYGHERGVIHRDLKPDNLMLDENDRIIVMDYGIAKAGEGSGLTQTGSVIGTPQYMSPEQARGTKLDARSDIYSLGIVLYQMATGELPFQATDAASLMYMHVHETPEPPDARNVNIPLWLRNIILKCLSKNPDDRFAHSGELKAALAERYSPKVTVTPLKDRARKRKMALMAGLAGAAVIVIGLAVWFFQWQAAQKQQVAPTQAVPGAQAPAKPAEIETAKDDKSFQQALSVNAKESYTAYLMLYPEGKHIEEAKAKIAELEQAAQQAQGTPATTPENAAERERREAEAAAARAKKEEEERARQDDMAFQQAEMVNSKQSYSTYLKNYTNGRHADEAMKKLASLDQAEAERMKALVEETGKKDDQSFDLVSKENTKLAYNTYLISYPSGRHIEEARTRIEAFDKKDIEVEKIRVALSSLSIRLVKIPRGSFIMGSEKGGADEKPVKTITISGFDMCSTEITQGLYNKIMGKNPSYFKLDDNCPVEKISWQEAAAFCNKLSEKVGLESCYDLSSGACTFNKNGFRLPTEAEWEYACRAEAGTEYNLGDGESALDRAGWYARSSGEHTHPVGQKTQNSWGLYDMHGNVWEWCNDWYDKQAYQNSGANNPTGPSSGAEKAIRGGGWLDNPTDCRSSKRKAFKPDKVYSDIGFRVVRR